MDEKAKEGKIFVKPKRGLVVRKPEAANQILKNEGEFVNDSPAWRRLLRFGDVKISKPKEEPKHVETKEENTDQGGNQ